jgi:hypothetical protein
VERSEKRRLGRDYASRQWASKGLFNLASRQPESAVLGEDLKNAARTPMAFMLRAFGYAAP